jgi:hypothetical protein
MAGKPTDQAEAPGSGAGSRERPGERTGRSTDEREGPLDVQRLTKGDGRALILYTSAERER